MQIGELANNSGMTTKTIRYYESIGLLPPARRSHGGYRMYDNDAIERLRFVREAQRCGLTLSEIQSILELKQAGASTCEHTRALLAQHLVELDSQIEQLQRTRAELVDLAKRTAKLDPAECVDPNRCQILAAPVT